MDADEQAGPPGDGDQGSGTPQSPPAAVVTDPMPSSGQASPASSSTFVVTKEHRCFIEFADAVRRSRYIGLCFGPPGVGKTLSARRYAAWEVLAPYLDRFRLVDYGEAPRPCLRARTIVYTPKVHNTPRILDKEVRFLHDRLNWTIESTLHPDRDVTELDHPSGRYAELLTVDEADRLKTPALEQLRDHHDRTGIGVILIGMLGIEKRLARFPSSTAASDSSTTTGHCPPPSRRSCWPGTGPTWAWTTPTTSPPARPSPPSPASPAGTSGSPAA